VSVFLQKQLTCVLDSSSPPISLHPSYPQIYDRTQIVHRLAGFGIYPSKKTPELAEALAVKDVQLPEL
jgi:hypothetical protein